MINLTAIWLVGGVPIFALVVIAGWMAGLIGREAMRLALGISTASRLPVLGALVAIAPLIGLLGTVVGLVTVFSPEVPPDAVAAGISQALITTQIGLLIAVPGLICRQLLLRWQEFYRAHRAQAVYRLRHPAAGEVST